MIKSFSKFILLSLGFIVLIILGGLLSEPLGKIFGQSVIQIIRSLVIVGGALFITNRLRRSDDNIGIPAGFIPDKENPLTGPIIIEEGKGFTLFLGVVFICVALLPIGIVIYRDYVPLLFLFFSIALLILTPYFLFAAYHRLLRLLSSKPQLIIDTEGITDDVDFFSIGKIRWNEITRVFPYSIFGQPAIGLVLKDLDSMMRKQSSFKRIIIKYYQLVNVGAKTPINIPGNSLGLRVEDLVKSMERYVDEESRKTIQFG